MNELERYKLVKFCVMAKSFINGVEQDLVDENEFSLMNDKELQKESDWLDELLNK